MTDISRAANLLAQLEHLNEQQLRRMLVEHLTKDQSRLRVADGGFNGGW